VSKYSKISLSKTLRSKSGEVVKIHKFRKGGTKRTFFAPEVNGNRFSGVMWARLYDAERVAKLYLNRKK